MAECREEIEEICLCRDCAVINCYRCDCCYCEEHDDDIHEVFFCNQFKEVDCSK